MELEILKAIQSIANPFFDWLFEMITILGEQTTIIIAIAIIYWAFNKRFALFIVYSTLTNTLVNGVIKGIFNRKRPIGEPGIRSLRTETATGHSFPSGHTQQATGFYGSMAQYINKKGVYIFVGLLILLIGFSRLYLGVHWPTDVLCGAIFGIITLLITNYLFNKVEDKALLFIGTFIVFLPTVFFVPSADLIKALGAFGGVALGTFIETRFVNFSEEGTTFKKIIRVILGIVFVLAVKVLTKKLFPDTLTFDFVRYMILTLALIGIYPAIFKKLNL